MYRVNSLLIIALFLSGCPGAGMMKGMMRKTGDRVTMNYQDGMGYDDLQVIMPDGETFKGKVVKVGPSSGIGPGLGSASATSSTGASTHGTDKAFGAVETYNGNMQGVLFGDRKHTMRCKLQYVNPDGFTDSGGVGVCETSDGRVIDVQW